MALVGENGAGKTCLFRMLLGQMSPSRGDVHITAGVRIGYLDQLPLASVHPEATCLGVARKPFAPLIALEKRMAALSEVLAQAPVDYGHLLDELGQVQAAYEDAGGYTYAARIEAMLHGLGLPPESWSRPVSALSAGQKVRLALATLLLDEYDLLLLDEPTNHLDIEAREWLGDYLAGLATTYVVVSHDRRFLDHVTTKTAYLDRGQLTLYSGGYSFFRHQLETERESAWQVYEQGRKQVRKLEAQARAYRNWSGAKEREKRGAADKGFVGRRAAKLMKRALAVERRLEEKIEALRTEKPFVKDPVAIEFAATDGKRLLSVSRLAIGYDVQHPLSSDLTWMLGAGDRLAVVGRNGSGKSTLLRTLLGELPPLAGEIRWAASAAVGYFDQENRQLPANETALAAVLMTGRDETVVRTVMGRLRISRNSVFKRVSELSAGERAKVLLARLMLGGYNVLVLDEPTNHLDIETQDVLLEALLDYPGAIVFVSHDRHFVETLATERLEL